MIHFFESSFDFAKFHGGQFPPEVRWNCGSFGGGDSVELLSVVVLWVGEGIGDEIVFQCLHYNY